MTTRRRSAICRGLLLVIGATVFVAPDVEPAAIPMWEYLSKDEKMSYLYSMFANQVEDFCETSDMRDCHRELLKFGLGKLKDMPEDHLDAMDPYQRGAHTLIWDSMMAGHEMTDAAKQRQRPAGAATTHRTTTAKPNSYEDDQFAWKGSSGGEFAGAASAKIETVVYRLPPPQGFVMANGPSQYVGASGVPRPQAPLPGRRTQQRDDDAPLTGPMVVKVHLDGTPVRGGPALPQDEDLKQYKMSQAKIPTFR